MNEMTVFCFKTDTARRIKPVPNGLQQLLSTIKSMLLSGAFCQIKVQKKSIGPKQNMYYSPQKEKFPKESAKTLYLKTILCKNKRG